MLGDHGSRLGFKPLGHAPGHDESNFTPFGRRIASRQMSLVDTAYRAINGTPGQLCAGRQQQRRNAIHQGLTGEFQITGRHAKTTHGNGELRRGQAASIETLIHHLGTPWAV